MGRLIPDILVESKLVARLEEMNFHDDLYTYVRNPFKGKNVENMLIILDIVDLVMLDKESVSTRRVEIDDFPTFTKLDPQTLYGNT